MSYYIKDTTINKIIYKNNVQEVVKHLEEVCKRYHRRTRSSYMDEMVSLGHGYDDDQGAYFTELLGADFDIGVVKRGGKHVKCNIHEHARNVRYRNEMGD